MQHGAPAARPVDVVAAPVAGGFSLADGGAFVPVGGGGVVALGIAGARGRGGPQVEPGLQPGRGPQLRRAQGSPGGLGSGQGPGRGSIDPPFIENTVCYPNPATVRW